MLMKTLQKESPTKEKLLNAAEELMRSKGFSATSVDEICEEAGVTKGSFFHYFDSKDNLGREVLERFCCKAGSLHSTFIGEEKDPLKRVLKYIDASIKLSQDPVMAKGCLLGTFAQELSDMSPEIRKACCEGFENWSIHFSSELAAAKKKYKPKEDFNPKSLAKHYIAILEGALLMGKAKKNMSIVSENLKHFRRYIEMLFA